jgi:hypothetical protein
MDSESNTNAEAMHVKSAAKQIFPRQQTALIEAL